MNTDRVELSSLLGYTFQDPALLDLALSHTSAREAGLSRGNYERLEFLGDRVLGLVIAERLYHAYPEEPEGDLAVRLNALVRAETCAMVAAEIGLGAHIRFSDGEAKAGRQKNASILADTCESVIGAIYLDGGIGAAAGFIDRFWNHRIEGMMEPPRDPKTILQEWVHKRGYPLPVYTLVSRKGPDHAPMFEIEVVIDGLASARGRDGSKRSAEQAAASRLLKHEGVGY